VVELKKIWVMKTFNPFRVAIHVAFVLSVSPIAIHIKAFQAFD